MWCLNRWKPSNLMVKKDHVLSIAILWFQTRDGEYDCVAMNFQVWSLIPIHVGHTGTNPILRS